jgi:uncharacterized protein YbbC (DUF1343 family)
MKPDIVLGIDRFLVQPPALGQHCALITAASAIDSLGRPVYRLLHQTLGKRLRALWSLQHGFCNDKQDNMILSDSFVHPELKIPVLSLYGEALIPQAAWLEGIDTIIADIQDVGTRVYTFTNHLVRIARHLSGRPLTWILLDRPNPLGGTVWEGPLLEPTYRSIVGELPVPMRHGLTAGEYLRLAIAQEKLDIDLRVMTLENWNREDREGGIWTLPSPNMPTAATARLYPGSVLLEGTILSEGRGTTRPFELVGAPWIDAQKLAENMNRFPEFGIQAIPMHFKPEFSKYRGQVCHGLLCHQPKPRGTLSFAFFYELLRFLRRHQPADFAWSPGPYEFEYTRPPIDMINGGPSLRLAVEADMPVRDWLIQSEAGYDAHRERIKPSLLYT